MRLAGTRLKHHPSRAGLTIDTKAGPVWTGEPNFTSGAAAGPEVARPRMIFWNAHGDLFHESVPNEWIDRCFAGMALTPQHKHQVLTKRTERMREWATDPATPSRMWRSVDALIDDWDEGKIKCRLPVLDGDPKLAALAAHGAAWGGELPWPLKNVWLGTSVEDQKRAEERIPILLDTPAAVRWLSCEPLLGPIDLSKMRIPTPEGCTDHDCWAVEPLTGRMAPIIELGSGDWALDGGYQTWGKIDWVVAGGESGPGARPMHPSWARSIRDQCASAGVPFLFKQWGEWRPVQWHERRAPGDVDLENDPYLLRKVGKKTAGRVLDGVQHDGYPA
jgi:protein gp37